jgi:hypothetical protein
MFVNLQRCDLTHQNTAPRAAVSKRMVPMIANTSLLLGLIIIPTLSGVLLIA